MSPAETTPTTASPRKRSVRTQEYHGVLTRATTTTAAAAEVAGGVGGGGAVSANKRNKLEHDDDDEDDDGKQQQQRCYTLLDLHRLVHAMERDPVPANRSWRDIHMRADLCHQMMVSLLLGGSGSSGSSKSQQPHGTFAASHQDSTEQLKQRVEAACLRAAEVAAELKLKDSSSSADEDPVQKIFFQKKGTAVVTPAVQQQQQLHDDSLIPPQQLSQKPAAVLAGVTRHNTPPSPAAAAMAMKPPKMAAMVPTPPSVNAGSIAELQRQQREQMEEAVSQMAAQMKDQTAQIHSALRGQTEHLLTDVEEAAEDNVAAVSRVAADTVRHGHASWRRTAGTWTAFFTVCAAFALTLLTIATVPKRPMTVVPNSNNQCWFFFFFCRRPASAVRNRPVPNGNYSEQFCRTLPSGRQECFDYDAQPTLQQQQQQQEQREAEEEAAAVAAKEDEEVQVVHDDVPIHQELPTIGEPHQEIASHVAPVEDVQVATEEEDVPDQHRHDDRDAVGEAQRGIVNEAPAEGEEEPVKDDEDAVAQPRQHDDTRVTTEEPRQAGSVNEAPAEEEEEPVDDDEDAVVQPHQHDDRVTAGVVNEAPVEDLQQEQDSMLWGDGGWDGSPVEGGHVVEVPDHHEDYWDGWDDSVDEEEPAPSYDEILNEIEEANAEEVASKQHQQDEAPIAPEYSFRYSDAAFAASTGDLELLLAYLEQKPSLIHEQDQNGWSLLHEASRHGETETIRLLLEAGGDPSLRTIAGQFTALDLALSHGEDHPTVILLKQAMGLLVEETRAAQDEQNCEIGMDGECILNSVPQLNIPSNEDMLEAALREFDEMKNAATQRTAAASPQKLVSDFGDDAFEQGTGVGDPPKQAKTATPMFDGKRFSVQDFRKAASNGNARLIRGYLAANPLFIDQADKNGWNALHLACRGGFREVVEMLVGAGSDVHKRTRSGRTVVDIAIAEFGRDSPMTKLLEPYMEQ